MATTIRGAHIRGIIRDAGHRHSFRLACQQSVSPLKN
jgi:hypothetical protein